MRAPRRIRIRLSDLPESLAQARDWEKAKVRYLQAGLCDRCASQAAWAHQPGAGGWWAVHPPCNMCAELIPMLPLATPNPAWRSLRRKRAARRI